MSQESEFHRLRQDLTPSEEARSRILMRVRSRIEAPAMLRDAKDILTPSKEIHLSLWQRIASSLSPSRSFSLFERLKNFLSPSTDTMDAVRARVFARLQERLDPVPSRWSFVPLTSNGLKWASAFVIIMLVLRVSPALFLTQHSIAESVVLAVPTRDTVSMLIHGFWQPVVEELELKEGGLQFQTTSSGALTIMLHDDGNVRLGGSTTSTLHDISDRPEPVLDGPTVTLQRGTLWVQGLLPDYLRGITVSTPAGDVVVHGGSASIDVGATTEVRVFDGHVTIRRDGQSEIQLVAGEHTELWQGNVPTVKKISAREYDSAWVSENLSRDAVHRKEIAQWQQERRAAEAGILPTSPLYSVKRVAERMDVLLTFNGEDKVRKQLEQASTRLDEAAALLAQGNSGASIPLEEFKTTLMDLSSGTGSDTTTQFLIRQQVAENSAQLSAAVPSDQLYALKKAVLEASAQLPDTVLDESDVQGVLLVDSLGAAQESIESGDIVSARVAFDQLKPFLTTLQGSGDTLKPDVRKEAYSILDTLAVSLGEQALTATGSASKDLLKEVAGFLPPKPVVVVKGLSEEEVDAIVQAIYNRVFLYKQPRARWNQLEFEMFKLRGNPDEGTILRNLYHALPENGLAKYVRTEIQRLSDEQGRRQLQNGTGACEGGIC